MKRILWLVVVVFMGLFAIQQSAGPAMAQTDDEPELMSPIMKAGLAKKVTLDADDAFLPAVLTILAEKSGFNIVTGPGVNKQERISVQRIILPKSV